MTGRITESGAVITGIGTFSSLGRGAADTFDALCHGKSGLVRPPAGHLLDGSVDVAGIAPDIAAGEVLPPSEGRLVDRYALMALAAADDAMADAGLVVGRDADPHRVAVIISSGAGGLSTYEAQALARAERGPTAVSPYLLPGMLPNMAAARIAIKYGIRGWSSAIATACAAGAHAVAEAARLIRYGEADVVVCGGAEAPLNPTSALAFAHARALSHGWDDPEAASRPFDRRRNGFVLAEGAGVLVVERAGHAEARGAAGYADLLGWGATTDAYRPTAPRPDGEGAAMSMRGALATAGLGPQDIGYINAHGTSTKLGDIAETKAVHAVFGDRSPAVSSTKSMTGHLLGGSGALEAAVCALAISQGRMPPTHNLDEVDPACDLDHVRGEARQQRIEAAISNSFAFGGHNVSLLLGAASTPKKR
ncbi:beta-ketoacyl-[acyl-carrier-protein] synthase family protein [Streptomyces sp. NBC_00385]|uniref:beta-ketoacyl-[acyl-carrier-protein] synthase family protein n=1 Tax=Streptomyces sp. NBC_00385 TaxID=2975733 RepID=UPI002DDB7219|nr:beta-ketoacyl-[acyl-carrier-protein] synthase family protein [Streptomyces sp. NBC_00385]WRZ05903.1 beta-ketoacyl-[acyl-carrier-protein] synthase family protein [Streptomyces sp. NBC_00385]